MRARDQVCHVCAGPANARHAWFGFARRTNRDGYRLCERCGEEVRKLIEQASQESGHSLRSLRRVA